VSSWQPSSALQLGRRTFLKTGVGAAASLLTSGAWPQAGKRGVYLPSGTKKMAALLRRIYEQSDWKADPDKTAQRTAYYRSLLRNRLTPAQEVTVRLEIGRELLRTGASAEALSHCLAYRATSNSRSINRFSVLSQSAIPRPTPANKFCTVSQPPVTSITRCST
jgi:hypothetical protein